MNSPKIRGEKVLVQKYDLHVKSIIKVLSGNYYVR